ncbi:Uncharacterised protein [uncultured archaeon]|nr:Uncharacterised protein [uncultured archaeon]
MAAAQSKPHLLPAMLAGLVGLLWLAQDMGWLASGLPLGPISILVMALALIRYAYN